MVLREHDKYFSRGFITLRLTCYCRGHDQWTVHITGHLYWTSPLNSSGVAFQLEKTSVRMGVNRRKNDSESCIKILCKHESLTRRTVKNRQVIMIGALNFTRSPFKWHDHFQLSRHQKKPPTRSQKK